MTKIADLLKPSTRIMKQAKKKGLKDKEAKAYVWASLKKSGKKKKHGVARRHKEEEETRV